MANIDITIDLQADAAYIELSSEDVATTVALTKDVNIDLDEQRCVVGIEVLSLAADIPFSDLPVKYHVRSEVVEALRLIRPSVSTFVTKVHASRDSGQPHEASRQTVTS